MSNHQKDIKCVNCRNRTVINNYTTPYCIKYHCPICNVYKDSCEQYDEEFKEKKMEMEKSYIESIHHLSVDVVEKYQQLLKTKIKCTLIMQSKSPFISVKKKVAAEMHIAAEKTIFHNLIYNLLDSSMFETHDFIIDIDEFQVHARQYGNKRKIKLNKFLGVLLRDFNEKRVLCDIIKNKKFVTINTQANAIYDMENARKKFIAALIAEWPCTEQAIDIKFQTHDYITLIFNEDKK